MKENLEKLLRDNKIVRYQSSREEIDSKINISESNLRSAKKIIPINDPDVDDTAYKETYNAILEAAMALMYHEGYRVARERGSHHLIVQQFTEAKFAGDFTADVINIFGHARHIRNSLQYDLSGAVSHADVDDLYSKAEEFVKIVKRILKIDN